MSVFFITFVSYKLKSNILNIITILIPYRNMHTNARFRSIIRRYGMLVILFLAVSLCSSAQEEATSQQHAWQAIIGEMMDDSDEDVAQWESIYDALCGMVLEL